MLSSSERRAAQRRWVESIGKIESATTAGVVASMGSVRGSIERIIREMAEEARGSRDPQFFIVQNSQRIAAEVNAQYLRTDRTDVAAIIGAAAESAYLLGVSEGAKRVAKVTKRRAKSVPADEQGAERRRYRREAEADVDNWVSTSARSAGPTAVRHLFNEVTVGAAVAVPAMLAYDQYRSSLLTRNYLVGAGRGGMQSSYLVNEMATWVWVAGATACEWCWGKTGLAFPATTRFQSHVNCRCSAEPSTGFQGFNADILFSNIPEAQRRRVLGPGKLDLWEQGRISLRDIPNGDRSRTLKDLSQL